MVVFAAGGRSYKGDIVDLPWDNLSIIMWRQRGSAPQTAWNLARKPGQGNLPCEGASGFVMPVSLQLNRGREHKQVGRVCGASGELPGRAKLEAIVGTISQCFVVDGTVRQSISFVSFVLTSRPP